MRRGVTLVALGEPAGDVLAVSRLIEGVLDRELAVHAALVVGNLCAPSGSRKRQPELDAAREGEASSLLGNLENCSNLTVYRPGALDPPTLMHSHSETAALPVLSVYSVNCIARTVEINEGLDVVGADDAGEQPVPAAGPPPSRSTIVLTNFLREPYIKFDQSKSEWTAGELHRILAATASPALASLSSLSLEMDSVATAPSAPRHPTRPLLTVCSGLSRGLYQTADGSLAVCPGSLGGAGEAPRSWAQIELARDGEAWTIEAVHFVELPPPLPPLPILTSSRT